MDPSTFSFPFFIFRFSIGTAEEGRDRIADKDLDTVVGEVLTRIADSNAFGVHGDYGTRGEFVLIGTDNVVNGRRHSGGPEAGQAHDS